MVKIGTWRIITNLQYYSSYWCYIHQTYTNCSSWLDLLMPCGGLCPWATFYAWVTMVRKKLLGLYYSTYWCYIHQTCTNCSSWHDLLLAHGGLCPWPTCHTWLTMVRKKWLSPFYSTYECNIHRTYTNWPSWHDLLMSHAGLCPWPTFHASVTKTRNGNSGAPSQSCLVYYTYKLLIHFHFLQVFIQ